MSERIFNPLDKTAFSAIAYNAVGRASEVNNRSAYSLAHSTGNSGWSVGFMQWDFGQPGRQEQVDVMLENYQLWAFDSNKKIFSENELKSLSTRLKTRGQQNNELTESEEDNLNKFLQSDEGRSFISSLDQQQIERKWENIGQPLSEISWLQAYAEKNPQEAAKIVAMNIKLFNQNEVRGKRLLEHLKNNELTADQVDTWISNEGIQGLKDSAQKAILSGKTNALAGIALLNNLETGDNALSREWRHQVYTQDNYTLTTDFSNNPSVQLLDKMFRDPIKGQSILAHLDPESTSARIVMAGTAETARVELKKDHSLHVRSPEGVRYELKEDGWQQLSPETENKQQSQTSLTSIANSATALLLHHVDNTLPHLNNTQKEQVAAYCANRCIKQGLAPDQIGQVLYEQLSNKDLLCMISHDQDKIVTADLNKALNTPVEQSLAAIEQIQQPAHGEPMQLLAMRM